MTQIGIDLNTIAICSSETLRGRALKELVLTVGGILEVLSLSDKEIAQWLCRFRRHFEGKDAMYQKAERIYKDCLKQNVKGVFLGDETYPIRLKEIYNPPYLLYYKGELTDSLCSLGHKVWSIVGSRGIEEHMKETTASWASYLTEKGIHIVSGMAIGTDAMAHWGALQSGVTSAVLGGGVDVIYPYGNAPLYRAILDGGGAILSEHPPGIRPLKYHFPLRNRIISGISDGVLLMQSAVKGGGMITVKHALESDRDVLVYAGDVFSKFFTGNCHLIEQGAMEVHSIGDLAKAFGFTEANKAPLVLSSPLEEKIMQTLSSKKLMSIVEIAKQLVLTTDKISGVLLNLVLKGAVGESPGKRYFKKYH